MGNLWYEFLEDLSQKSAETAQRGYDNLFSANARMKMEREYGFSSAEIIKISELI